MGRLRFGEKVQKNRDLLDYPHPDYEKNYNDAISFIKNMKEKMPKGMSMSIGDGHGLDASIFWIGWQGDVNIKAGTYAFPIMIHQGNRSFKKEVVSVYYSTCEISKKYL